MPSVNPRIAVYLPRNVAATVQRLAAMRGVSRSAVIRDFLTEAEPVMARVANLLDLAARSDRTALKEWAVTMEAEQGKMEQAATGALAVLDHAMGEWDAIEAKTKKRKKGPARQAPRGRRPRTPGQ